MMFCYVKANLKMFDLIYILLYFCLILYKISLQPWKKLSSEWLISLSELLELLQCVHVSEASGLQSLQTHL